MVPPGAAPPRAGSRTCHSGKRHLPHCRYWLCNQGRGVQVASQEQRVAVVAGNPNKPGMFVERLTLPKGSSILQSGLVRPPGRPAPVTRFDPPASRFRSKMGTFAKHFAKRVHGKDDDNMTPVTTAPVDEAQ
jgi:hypothetical protein